MWDGAGGGVEAGAWGCGNGRVRELAMRMTVGERGWMGEDGRVG